MTFTCDRCNKTFTARYLLNRHLVAHTRVRNHLCPVCGEAFLQSSALNRHAASHEARLAYQCEECGKRFNRSSTRDVHQASHAEKKHVCKWCGKAFHQNSTLKTHILIHTESRPFPCYYCEKTFRQRSNLKVHISRQHKGTSESLRKEDYGFARKKEEDLCSSRKFGRDIRKENVAKGDKESKCRHNKDTDPSDSKMLRLRDVDIVDKINTSGCNKTKCDLNNDNKDVEKISDMCQSRVTLKSNNSLQMLENSSKDCRNSTTVANENKLLSDSEDDELETEECPSLVHPMSARSIPDNSKVSTNVGEKSDSKLQSRSAPLTEECCKDINNRKASHQPSNTEVSGDAQKVVTGIYPVSGNRRKVDDTSKTAATMELDYSFSVRNHPSASSLHTKLVEATDMVRNDGKISSISNALPNSLSALPQSNINIQTNPSQFHTRESISKHDEQSLNVENFLSNVFNSCRLATNLVKPPVTRKLRATIPCGKKLAPRSCDFSAGKTSGDRHHRISGSTSRKPEKLMYVKLYTPEKSVTEFIWS